MNSVLKPLFILTLYIGSMGGGFMSDRVKMLGAGPWKKVESDSIEETRDNNGYTNPNLHRGKSKNKCWHLWFRFISNNRNCSS